ncbi:unnamed protein product [Bemisia tabaci]|uniref:Immunoglobulin I-set domain-containing protein n=1 Tax=Bemisia tabaci TaxID=7038 RepID=A0A9P0EXE0_BEMTA|nr:unnamed protein product [Bemisia tabaci]
MPRAGGFDPCATESGIHTAECEDSNLKHGRPRFAFWRQCSLNFRVFPDPCGPKSTSLRHRQHGGSSGGGGGAASGNSGGNEAAINEYTVQQHEEARLLCDLVGNDSIQWLHDGVPIGAAHNRYSREPRLNMLTISNVHLEDNGVWQAESPSK